MLNAWSAHANERYYERALTAGDPNLRWHFNLPKSVGRSDNFTFTIDFYNLSETDGADTSSYDLSFFVDGKQIGEIFPRSVIFLLITTEEIYLYHLSLHQTLL